MTKFALFLAVSQTVAGVYLMDALQERSILGCISEAQYQHAEMGIIFWVVFSWWVLFLRSTLRKVV